MCNTIHSCANKIAQEVCSGISAAHNEAVKDVQWLGRKIHDITHFVLPEPIAIIAEAAIKSLPVSATLLLLPPAASVAVICAAVAYRVIFFLVTKQPVSFKNLHNGIGFAEIISGCRNISAGLSTSSPFAVSMGLLSIVFAIAVSFSRSGLLRDLSHSLERPSPAAV
jgi:hypothetical protein